MPLRHHFLQGVITQLVRHVLTDAQSHTLMVKVATFEQGGRWFKAWVHVAGFAGSLQVCTTSGAPGSHCKTHDSLFCSSVRSFCLSCFYPKKGCSTTPTDGSSSPRLARCSRACHRDVILPSYRGNLPLLEWGPISPLALFSSARGPLGLPHPAAPPPLQDACAKTSKTICYIQYIALVSL
jgi:hypothetical protein